MASFSIANKLTTGHEGYYVSEAFWRARGDNRSGETYLGIDRKANPNWQGWPVIDAYKANFQSPAWWNSNASYNFRFPAHLGLEAMKDAKFKADYWDPIKGDQIKNQELANLIFDIHIMSGNFGVMQIQRSINRLLDEPLAVDGKIGTKTLEKINDPLYTAGIYTQIRQDRLDWYKQKNNSNTAGWVNRLNKFPQSIAEAVEEAKEKVKEAYDENPTLFIIGSILLVLGGLALTYFSFQYYSKQTINKLRP
jgi:hypothetical protein